MMRWMTKLGLWSLAAVVPCALAGLSTSCSNTACEDLDALCSKCPNGTYRTDCLDMVSRDNAEVCGAQLPTFERVCVGVPAPPGTTTSTTTGSQGGGGAGGQASGGGGTGGQASGGGGTGGQASGGGGAGGSGGG
jgi:hypothetical protein